MFISPARSNHSAAPHVRVPTLKNGQAGNRAKKARMRALWSRSPFTRLAAHGEPHTSREVLFFAPRLEKDGHLKGIGEGARHARCGRASGADPSGTRQLEQHRGKKPKFAAWLGDARESQAARSILLCEFNDWRNTNNAADERQLLKLRKPVGQGSATARRFFIASARFLFELHRGPDTGQQEHDTTVLHHHSSNSLTTNTPRTLLDQAHMGTCVVHMPTLLCGISFPFTKLGRL